MRNVFIGFLFLVAIWLGWGAPVPGVGLRPLTPDPNLPVFGQENRDQVAVENAAFAGRLAEDQTQRTMRQRVIDTASRLEAFPCDAAAKRAFQTAVSVHMKDRLRQVRSGKDAETINVNGRKVGASDYLNREVSEIIEQAMLQGVLRPGDIGLPRGLMPPGGIPELLGDPETRNRFKCENQFGR
jgi:hypothetical protein